LKDDPKIIREYKRWHSEEYHWREIREDIKMIGILEMGIYIFGARLVMIVAPIDFDWNAAMNHLASLPRQKEWEVFVVRL